MPGSHVHTSTVSTTGRTPPRVTRSSTRVCFTGRSPRRWISPTKRTPLWLQACPGHRWFPYAAPSHCQISERRRILPSGAARRRTANSWAHFRGRTLVGRLDLVCLGFTEGAPISPGNATAKRFIEQANYLAQPSRHCRMQHKKPIPLPIMQPTPAGAMGRDLRRRRCFSSVPTPRYSG